MSRHPIHTVVVSGLLVLALTGAWIPRHMACEHHGDGHAMESAASAAQDGHCHGPEPVSGPRIGGFEDGCCGSGAGLMAVCCTDATTAPVVQTRTAEAPRAPVTTAPPVGADVHAHRTPPGPDPPDAAPEDRAPAGPILLLQLSVMRL